MVYLCVIEILFLGTACTQWVVNYVLSPSVVDDTLTCGDPPMIHHADYNHSESHYRLGYVIIYRCHRGFFPSVNPLIVTCLQRDSPAGLETGVWVRPEEDGEFLCLLSKEISKCHSCQIWHDSDFCLMVTPYIMEVPNSD